MNNLILTDNNYEQNTWHYSTIYSFSFPDSNLDMIFDIDFLMKTEFINGVNQFSVAPCLLTFHNVIHLELKIFTGLENGVAIDDITYKETKVNGTNLKEYIIHLFDNGSISFKATGFTQKALALPIKGSSMIYKERNLKDYKLFTQRIDE